MIHRIYSVSSPSPNFWSLVKWYANSYLSFSHRNIWKEVNACDWLYRVPKENSFKKEEKHCCICRIHFLIETRIKLGTWTWNEQKILYIFYTSTDLCADRVQRVWKVILNGFVTLFHSFFFRSLFMSQCFESLSGPVSFKYEIFVASKERMCVIVLLFYKDINWNWRVKFNSQIQSFTSFESVN